MALVRKFEVRHCRNVLPTMSLSSIITATRADARFLLTPSQDYEGGTVFLYAIMVLSDMLNPSQDDIHCILSTGIAQGAHVIRNTTDGRLPIHEAGNALDLSIFLWLLAAWPDSTRITDYSGKLPIHVLLANPYPVLTMDIYKTLFTANPECFTVVLQSGPSYNIPLHRIFVRNDTTPEIVWYFLKKFPGVLSYLDSYYSAGTLYNLIQTMSGVKYPRRRMLMDSLKPHALK